MLDRRQLFLTFIMRANCAFDEHPDSYGRIFRERDQDTLIYLALFSWLSITPKGGKITQPF